MLALSIWPWNGNLSEICKVDSKYRKSIILDFDHSKSLNMINIYKEIDEFRSQEGDFLDVSERIWIDKNIFGETLLVKK